jgi:hypothetical protein
MTRRRRLRRRLLWASVLLSLVLVVALLSVLNAGLWIHDQVVSIQGARRTNGREKTMSRTTALAVLMSLAALVLVAPASADPWGSDRPIGERAPAAAPAPDWFERFTAAHSPREPVVDDRFTIDPTNSTTTVATTSAGDIEWPQVGVGLALGFGAALVLARLLATRLTHIRPTAAP